MGKGFRVRSFMSELNKSLHDRTSLRSPGTVTSNLFNLASNHTFPDLSVTREVKSSQVKQMYYLQRCYLQNYNKHTIYKDIIHKIPPRNKNNLCTRNSYH